jgi:hypothetical protein
MKNFKYAICLALAFSIFGCGETTKESNPKVVGDPKNNKYASPASDGPSGPTKNVSNDKTANTP